MSILGIGAILLPSSVHVEQEGVWGYCAIPIVSGSCELEYIECERSYAREEWLVMLRCPDDDAEVRNDQRCTTCGAHVSAWYCGKINPSIIPITRPDPDFYKNDVNIQTSIEPTGEMRWYQPRGMPPKLQQRWAKRIQAANGGIITTAYEWQDVPVFMPLTDEEHVAYKLLYPDHIIMPEDETSVTHIRNHLKEGG